MDLRASLENEMLLVRALVPEDREPLYQAASDPLIWEQHPCKRYIRAEFDTFFDESIDSKGALTVIDKAKRKVIGSSRFKTFPEFPAVAEIGWTFLARSYWGGTYNRSLKELMLSHAFRLVESVVFFVDARNIRSQRAVRKIGGKPVDNAQYHELPLPGHNNLTFEVKKDDWLKTS